MNICRGLSGLAGMTLPLTDETGPDPTMLIVPLKPVADELRRVLEGGAHHGS